MSSCTTIDDSRTNRGATQLCQTIHRALSLPELVSVIFSNLNRADLARAEKVCQLWSFVALDWLWECIPDIDGLINVYSQLKRDEDELLHFEDVSNGGHWDQFWARAASPSPVSWDDQALSIFSVIPSGLEALSFRCSPTFALSAVPKLNQALTESSVERLKSLDLHNVPTSEALTRTCTNILHQQKFLERLQLSSLALTTEEVQNIGDLPHLTDLYLHHQGGSVQELREAFATIGKLFPNLRSICLVDGMQLRVDIMVMEGLASCHELRAVTLKCALPQPVTAEAIRTLACYWPKLEKLAFDSFHPPSNLVGAPLAILEDVALAWSETFLTLSFVCDTSQELPQTSAVRGRFKQKVSLDLDYTVLHKDQVIPVAEFITTLGADQAPDICFNVSRPGDHNSRGCWESVQKLVTKSFISS
ncbi:hypothetical protein FRC04_010109 [Tulasnella sp. 424]|nr:hypothetical protein FRC04_010109 [Tulasnella sp. 424]KAG8974131.1 hypothetical protein FRC05_007879 [Tulasnella sp. 425]